MGEVTEDDVAGRLAGFFASYEDPGLVAAYLFGSHAEARAHRDSDVDVGVLLAWDRVPTAAERFALRIRLIGELVAALHQNALDVVILNDCPPLFARRIVTRGVLLCCRDAAVAHAFVRDVQLRAADLMPFLRRTAAVKLASLSS